MRRLAKASIAQTNRRRPAGLGVRGRRHRPGTQGEIEEARPGELEVHRRQAENPQGKGKLAPMVDVMLNHVPDDPLTPIPRLGATARMLKDLRQVIWGPACQTISDDFPGAGQSVNNLGGGPGGLPFVIRVCRRRDVGRALVHDPLQPLRPTRNDVHGQLPYRAQLRRHAQFELLRRERGNHRGKLPLVGGLKVPACGSFQGRALGVMKGVDDCVSQGTVVGPIIRPEPGFEAEACTFGDSATSLIAGVAADLNAHCAHLKEGDLGERRHSLGRVSLALAGGAAPIADLELGNVPASNVKPGTQGELACISEETRYSEIFAGVKLSLRLLQEGFGLFQGLQMGCPWHPRMKVGEGLLDGFLDCGGIGR